MEPQAAFRGKRFDEFCRVRDARRINPFSSRVVFRAGHVRCREDRFARHDSTRFSQAPPDLPWGGMREDGLREQEIECASETAQLKVTTRSKARALHCQ